MTVANYNANQIWLQLVKHQHRLNRLVVALLVIFLLAYAAELTWRFMPQPAQIVATNSAISQVSSNSENKAQTNLTAVKRLNLFGDLTAKPVVEKAVTDAPETKLNLTLTGVVASNLQENGAAIIENRGQQQTYGVGEKIEGTNASLREVHADRVIIKNGIRNETLMLDGIDFSKAGNNASRPINQPASPSSANSREQRRTLSPEAIAASKQLQSQPANFTDFIAISPHRPNGDLVGYRVRPGKKPSLFNAAGLKAGDVITEINGLDLTNVQQSIEAMNMLKQLQSLQMTVMRKQELITIYLDLPEGEEEY